MSARRIDLKKFRDCPFMRAKEVIAYLGKGLYEDARASGKLEPTLQRGPKFVTFKTADVYAIAAGIAEGQYPIGE